MAADKRLICRSADLTDGGPGVRFTVTVHNAPAPAFVVRHDGRVCAYLNQCAHVNVELDWQEGQFFDADGAYLICATHGALYEPQTGACVAGPCRGRSLTRLDVAEEGGQIYLLPADTAPT